MPKIYYDVWGTQNHFPTVQKSGVRNITYTIYLNERTGLMPCMDGEEQEWMYIADAYVYTEQEYLDMIHGNVDTAEQAYLQAEYNSVLLEMLL